MRLGRCSLVLEGIMDEFGLIGLSPELLGFDVDPTLVFSDEELNLLEIEPPAKKAKDIDFDDKIPW
jgi:hypothetical protein